VSEGAFELRFSDNIDINELKRGLNRALFLPGRIEAWDRQILNVVLRRAAELGMALPDTPVKKYEDKIAAFLAKHPDERGTEKEQFVRQRVGQDLYREALVKYWGGVCAITAIDVPELLVASHAKPWKDCDTDADRLNVYNGFLLVANYDALFDSGLITFDDNGGIIYSSRLSKRQLVDLDLQKHKRLRWINERHLPFVRWHRENIFRVDSSCQVIIGL
jgi:predicted restriction endonuclease